jgi:predicted peroxiredoxin
MQKLKLVFIPIVLSLLFVAGQARAAEDKSMGLFVNLTVDQTGKAGHAVQFAGKMMERGHSVTYFLNSSAVLIASKNVPQGTYEITGKTVRDMLADQIKSGAKVIVCQVCAKMHGINAKDLIAGAQVGDPDLVSSYLFDPTYQVISW